MNLFFLDIDPKKCAEYHCDKHVVKMILEIVQMLYTAHHKLGTVLPKNSYRPFNPQHPTAVWIRLCVENYTYAADVAFYLCEEYRIRYNRVHSCESHLIWLRDNKPNFKSYNNYKNENDKNENDKNDKNENDKNENYKNDNYENPYINSKKKVNLRPLPGFTDVPLAMPEDSMRNDAIKSYRAYYNIHKKRFATWKTTTPDWYCPIQIQLLF